MIQVNIYLKKTRYILLEEEEEENHWTDHQVLLHTVWEVKEEVVME